jgi:hypothetical protein
MRSIIGVRPFTAVRELRRKVQADCVIEVDGNAYSVPWRLIGESVRVTIGGRLLRVSHGAAEVAVHVRREGRRQRIVDPTHFRGVAGFGEPVRQAPAAAPVATPAPESALLRPLAEYEQLVGGGW